MLKNSLKKRVFLILSSLFIIFIIYIFPTQNEEVNVSDKKIDNEEAIIYLKDQNNFISRVSVYIKDKDLSKQVEEIINYLTIKSSNSNYIKEGFSPIIPENTKLLSSSVDGSLVKLNFSKEFMNVSADDEEKMISAIIYSLTSIEGINSVSIYVEGDILTKMPNSGKSLPTTLDRSFGINKIYDFTNFKGTTSTTIYYLAKNNDYYYYVPVTMVNNEQNEKMEIIITELSSKSTYQTGLISYLKSAKQMSYQYENDYISLNIEKDLFDSLSNANLLETVIYSMNLSIKDNYDISKVIYLVDNSIYKTYYI
jgi:germination protein M